MCAIGVSSARAAAPPTVFIGSYLERGHAQSKPRPGQVRDHLRIVAAPGEYEPAVVSVRAGEALAGVRIRIAGELSGEGGRVIPADAITVRLADPFTTWTEKTGIEQFLLSDRPVDIEADTTRRFWLTVRVPDDAAPGVYRTKLFVEMPMGRLGPDLMKTRTLAVLKFEVEVLPVPLVTAHETGMAYFMYNNTSYYAKAPGGAEALITEAYQARVFEDMREHGMTTATLYLYPVVDDEFTLTGRSANHLSMAATMRLLEQTRLVAPGVPVVWLGPTAYGPDVWKGVERGRREHGWPEMLYYAVDEPETEERNLQARLFMRNLNRFRAQHPHWKVRATTALGSSRGIQTVGYLHDHWITCMAQRIGESGVIADARMHRTEIWTYDCMAAPVDAETDRYYFGVWAWVAGVKGCSHWCYFDGMPRLSYVYPAKDELIPTVGWEAVREGIDDYRYLVTLKRLAGKVAAAGHDDLVRDAEAVFEQVKAMVTMDNYGKAYHKAIATGGDAGAYDRPRVEPDLPIERYDEIRHAAARLSVRIAEALRD